MAKHKLAVLIACCTDWAGQPESEVASYDWRLHLMIGMYYVLALQLGPIFTAVMHRQG